MHARSLGSTLTALALLLTACTQTPPIASPPVTAAPTTQPEPRPATSTPAAPTATDGQTEVVIGRADFDGDGQPDTVLGRLQSESKYETIRVQGADERMLLDLTTQGNDARLVGSIRLAQIVDIGAPHPALLLGDQGGTGGQTLMVYTYSAEQQRLMPLPWDSKDSAFGFPAVDAATHRVIVGNRMYDPVRHVRHTAFTWQDGRLHAVDHWYTPKPEEILLPTSPSQLLLAAFAAVSFELPTETRRYFGTPEQADRFYQAISGRAPAEAPWSTLTGEELDVPAVRAGKAVRFAVGAPDGKGGQVALQGELTFVQQGEQLLISEVRIDP